MAADPIFAATPRRTASQISAANTARDGTGTIVTCFTAGSSGSLIRSILIEATVTTTAGMVRLFLYDGSNYFLWKEIAVQAFTVSGTVKAFTEMLSFHDPEPLPNGWSIRASTHNAETFNVHITGADF